MEAIIKLSSLGDIIHSLIVLPLLDKKVDFIVDSSFKDILEYNPYIENIIDLNLRKAKKEKIIIFQELQKIRSLEKYDKVYDLQGLIKSGIIAKLVGKKVIGYKNPKEKIATIFYNEKIFSKKEFATERYLELFGLENSEFIKNHPKLLYFKDREFDCLSNSKKNVVFIIGATWECRRLPVDKWVELAGKLDENIIIPYTSAEQEDAEQIAKNNPHVKLIQLNLNDLKALISKVDLLIGNDTGPTFIAWANNINNIVLYGCVYSNKILDNRYSKAIEAQHGEAKKGLMVMDRIEVNDILKKIDEF